MTTVRPTTRRRAVITIVPALGVAVAAAALLMWALGHRTPADPPPAADATAARVASAARAWPGPANTGVPPGTILLPSGPVVVTTDNVVLSGLDVTGGIVVRAHNVTIKDSRIRGCGGRGAINTGYSNQGYGPVLIEDVELDGLDRCDVSLVGSSHYTAIRVNAHGARTGFTVENDVTIRDSWVHDLWYRRPAHQDAVLSNGGSDVTIDHNRLTCTGGGCAGAVGMYGDFAPVRHVLVSRNLLDTDGAYCLYAGSEASKTYPVATGVQVVDNHFGRAYSPRCGLYGPATGFRAGPGSVWRGNVWDGSGLPVTP